jgi:hypothetical protein
MAKKTPRLLNSEEQIAIELEEIIDFCRLQREELADRKDAAVTAPELKSLVDSISGAVKLKLTWEESRALQASKLSQDEELEVVAEYILSMTKQRRAKFMAMMTKKIPTTAKKESDETPAIDRSTNNSAGT